ncbi:gephyrin-like molybdotransferase Glp [Labedaea rhizosphaerae]|uniref:Molybdopterin molybdenumtransferase n=1 Tax=Labedaea rhizosphaerae TaxID=598644 RepID=A0A4R6SKF7_LABRH|nr:gephyrin-like molybdotransferase Glp [Labedaea rhizosphaerae]TDQ04608.1 molybdopterin molybdochelatase [Labedaea rhizosphaerae]
MTGVCAEARTALQVNEYRDRVAALLPAMPVRQTRVIDCLGLVLAEDVTAPISLPPFDNSAMDGYAVRSVDVVGATVDEPVVLPVAADLPAGAGDLQVLQPGTAHRIMTGAPLPPGADAVVQVELTDGGTEQVRIDGSVPPGTHVRRTGEDVVAGSVVLTAGTVLRSGHLGLAAAVGATALPVRRRPRVLLLSTGSELVPPGEPLGPGQIYESNGMLLAAAVTEAGAEPIPLHFVPDDVARFRETLADHLADADLLVTSGGVSMGAYEVVKDALTDQGVEFVKVAMQPGGPQGCGRYQGVPVVTLPGNPVSTALSFEVFVRPVLLAAMGFTDVARPTARASLTAAMRSPKGKQQFRRGHYDPAAGTAVPVGGPGSHLLASFAASNCLIVVPPDVTEVAEGDEVEVILIS